MTPSPEPGWHKAIIDRLSWLVPVLLFAAFVGYLLFAEHLLLFGPFMLPMGDNASDDLLVLDAKRLHLLHGNYSRFGFYHPGPWFLFVAAAGETVFYDWTGLFTSYFGAQIFAISLTHGVALAFSCRLWLLVTRRVSLALLATVIIAATILAPVAPINLFIQPWTPYSTVAASLLAATGLAGLMLRGPSWLPLLALGCVQMIHGHASFLGIVPVILGTALLLALLMGRLPFNPLSLRAALAWMRQQRVPLLLSVGIAVLYALPILLHTILHWPGEFGQYRAFMGSLPPQPIIAALHYEAAFIPAGGIWLLLFLLPDGIRRGPDRAPSVVTAPAADLRAAGLVVFLAAALPAFWYSWREVDNSIHRYLLLWLAPFMGTALVAALFHAIRSARLKPVWRTLLCMVLGGLSLRALLGVQPTSLVDVAGNLVWQRTVVRVLAQPAPAGSDRTELVLDRSTAAWVPVWIETVELLDAMRRAGRHDFCVSATTWHILFEQSSRCEPGRDYITRRVLVTRWPAHPSPSSFRLEQTGLIPMSP